MRTRSRRPTMRNALLNRGLAREKLGKDADALADFTAALALNTLAPADAARAQYDRGVALDKLGRMPEAIDAFSEALKLQPNFAAAYNNRANAHLRLGDLVTAKSDYEAALANGIASPEYVWYGLGQIAQAEGDIAGARDCYKKALGVNPGYSLATARLADLAKMGMPRPLAQTAPLPTARVVASASTKRGALSDVSYESADLSLRPSIDGGQAAAPGAAQIQLGAYRDEADARQTWKELTAKTGGLLRGLTPNIVPVDLPDRGRFYRLRAGVSDPSAAASLCDRLKSKGVDCFQVRG